MCTDIFNAKQLISGRTLDFALPAGLSLENYKVGDTIQGYATDLNGDLVLSLSWTVKYEYVASLAGIQGKDIVADGVNCFGLSIAMLEFIQSIYTAYQVDNHPPGLCFLSLGHYLLGTCKTVQDVQDALGGIALGQIVVTDSPSFVKEVMPYAAHFHVCDATGKAGVFEWLNGYPSYYDNTNYGVCTNSPSTSSMRDHLACFSNITNINARPSDKNITPWGNGSGMLGLPADATPPSRYVRAYFKNQFVQAQAPGESSQVTLEARLGMMSNVIGNVFVNLGECCATDTSALIDFSQIVWMRTHDLSGHSGYFYRTAFNPMWYGIADITLLPPQFKLSLFSNDNNPAFQSLI